MEYKVPAMAQEALASLKSMAFVTNKVVDPKHIPWDIVWLAATVNHHTSNSLLSLLLFVLCFNVNIEQGNKPCEIHLYVCNYCKEIL